MYSNINNPFREYDDAELIFLYVKDYKCLKDLDASLSASYESCYVDGLLHVDKLESYARKSEYLNIKLLCGSNGVGKTSILELLRQPRRSKGSFLVFKCSDDVFFQQKRLI